MTTPSYPSTRRDDSVVDTLHGHQVPDPYRWLEDADSDETKAWVKQQAALTDEHLASLPDRDRLKVALRESFDYEKIGAPAKRGDRYYFYYNTGVQQQSVLYSIPSLDVDLSTKTKVLDPNELSEDGTTGIGCCGYSESGRYMAYGLSAHGTDWRQVFVKDLTTMENLPDVLNWVKFSCITWTHDDAGFFYCRYTAPDGQESMSSKAGCETHANKFQKLCYHKLGQPEADDVVVMEDPEHENWMFGAEVTDDGKYVVFSTVESCAPMNLVSIAEYKGDVSALKSRTPIVSKWDAEYSYLANDGNMFYFVTNKDAPRKKIVSTVFTPGQAEVVWTDVLPEDPKRVLSAATVLHDAMLVVYMEDVVERLYIGNLAAPSLVEVPLPILGSIIALRCHRYEDWLMLKMTSYTSPGLILRATVTKEDGCAVPKLEKWREEIVPNLRSDDFTCRQMFYENRKDGTRVPLFILSPAGAENETLPCILYGYGGFNISLTPGFSTFRLTWVKNFRAHYVVACIRGGDEYGEDWHVGGSKDKKQNCFDDFQDAARHLIDSKLTTPKQLGILGGSNGGLLVAACANQAPELYGAVVAQVGVLDMYRFHKFTIGSAWMSEYGCPDEAKDFEVMRKYSPLHNIRGDVAYPNIMCMTGDHDDRVVPLHTFKYMSQLQHVNPPGGRYLARIEVSVGHGGTSPTGKRIEETADLYAFMANSLNAAWQTK